MPANSDDGQTFPARRTLAIVLPDLRGGGVERIRLELAREFARRGYRVEFVLMRARGELIEEARRDFEIAELGAAHLRDVPFALARYLRRRRPDMLLAAMWPLTGMAVLARLIAGSKCRLVVSEHNTLSMTPAYRAWSGRIHRLLGAWLYGQADGVVAVSAGVREDIHNATGLAAGRISVIHNPVRPPSANPVPTDPSTLRWWSAGDVRLVAVGSLKLQKDYATLLRAVDQLRRRRKVRLVILGEGPQRAELEAMIGTLSLEDSVRLPGFEPEPNAFLSQADLFVLSSAWEGFGNVIVEALRAGTPVVSTDCPSGPAEILENGRFGRLTPVGDAEALALAIEEALDAPADRELLRRRAADFSVGRAADEYLALLDPRDELPGH